MLLLTCRHSRVFKPAWLPAWTLLGLWTPVNVQATDAKPVVVVEKEGSDLEQYAAKQLCEYLNKLFAIQAAPVNKVPASATHVLLIGSPESNPLVAKALGADGWPKVSDQGIVLKHCQLDGKPTLVVGGGSARATLWAVFELVERWGVRYLLHGDVLPENAGTFRLPEDDVIMEPKFAVRQWRVINCFGCGPESWGIDDYRPVLDQLAKLKFNRIFAAVYPWQPFVDVKCAGIERKNAWLWWNFHLPITGDMPGRKLFGDIPEWWNPDLPCGADYNDFAAAGRRHVQTLFAYAESRGFDIGMTVNIAEFPKEFAPQLKDHRVIYEVLGNLTVTPGPLQPADDPALCDLASQIVKTTLDTYPEVDFIVPDVPEIPAWTNAYEKAWAKLDDKYDLQARFPLEKIIENASNRRGYAGGKERAVTEVKSTIATLYLTDKLLSERNVLADTKRSDAFVMFCSMAEEVLPVLPHVLPKGSETLNQIDYTPDRIVARPEAFANAGAGMRHNLIFTLHDDNVGLLPMSNTASLAILADRMQEHGWSGFSSRYWLISDHDSCVAFLARRAWDDRTTPNAVYNDQCEATCGVRAVPHLAEMMRELSLLTVELNQHGMGLTFPVGRAMIKRHLVPEAMSPEMESWRQSYRRALAAATRAHDVSTERGKPYTAYWIGRLQFGIGFFDCVEAARALATAQQELKQAETANDAALIAAHRTKVTDLAEAAVQTSRDMLESFAAVVRDPSDRGTIAMMAEYVYRPLQEELEKSKR